MKKILFVLSLFFLWKDNAMAVKYSCTDQSDCKNGFTCLSPLWHGPAVKSGSKFCFKNCSTNADCVSLKAYLGCTTSWTCESNICRCQKPH